VNRVAVLGLGGMGGGIARRLVEQGFPVSVWNRDPQRAHEFAGTAATIATTAADAARDAEVVIVSVSDEHAVDEVLAGGLADALAPGTLLLDATTVSPAYAVRAAQELGERNVNRLEVCLVGNPAMAAAGPLRVFTAGDPAVADKAATVLTALAAEIRHLGGPGSAAVLKLAFNMLLGAQVTALAEAVALGEAAGLDSSDLLGAITRSGFSSAVLAFRARFMASHTYTPAAFRSTLMAKDLRLACAAATGAGLALPVTERVRDRYAEVVAAGHGDDDASAVLELTRPDTSRGDRRP
jgi:3-hydroxyisobutyrate dehydrogenase-like beta-hydroxyacid dehydrogenase